MKNENCNGIYIGILPKYNDNANYEYWICNERNDVKSGYEEYTRDGYKYGGELRIEDYEIAAIIYNL